MDITPEDTRKKEGFHIELGKSNHVYYAGEKVTGRLVFDAISNEDIKKILIQITGITHTNWISKYENPGTSDIHLNHLKILNLKEEIGDTAKGVQANEFSFELPKNCPSSFEGKYGSIRYQLLAKVYFSLSKDNLTNFQTLTVSSVLNLNDLDHVRKPLCMEIGHHLGLFKCITGPLNATIRFEHSGFVPGEVSPLHIDLENYTKKKITNIFLEIIREETFKTNDPFIGTRRMETVCKCVDFGPENEIGERNIEASFQLPYLQPTGMNLSKYIDIKYYVFLTFKFVGCQPKLRFAKEIIIGTIPLLPKTKISPGKPVNQTRKYVYGPLCSNNLVL